MLLQAYEQDTVDPVNRGLSTPKEVKSWFRGREITPSLMAPTPKPTEIIFLILSQQLFFFVPLHYLEILPISVE